MLNVTIEYKGIEFDARHGGPFDRGIADSWYGRKINPHYYKGATEASELVETDQMTGTELADYLMGYEYNEQLGGKKEW